MSSQLKVNIQFIDYLKDFDFFQSNQHPLSDKRNLKVICHFYNLSLLKLSLIKKDNLEVEGIFFYKTINKRIFIFSGGRFGYSGFNTADYEIDINSYFPLIEKKFKELKVSSASLSIMFSSNKSNKTGNSWIEEKKIYQVASTFESVDDSGLSFRKALIRSNLSRNLKKAKNKNLKIKISKNIRNLEIWYEQCHLKRVKELKGKKWSLELLKNLFLSGSGFLVYAQDETKKILGGCFILDSNESIELFMLSTEKKFQNLGVNHLIIEKIYNLAYSKKRKYINWQASNPVNGPLAKFKEDWNAHYMPFVIYNKNFDLFLSKPFIENNFDDIFVFPFSEL